MGQGDGVGGRVTPAGPAGGGGGRQVQTVRSGRGLCKEVWEERVEESLKDRSLERSGGGGSPLGGDRIDLSLVRKGREPAGVRGLPAARGLTAGSTGGKRLRCSQTAPASGTERAPTRLSAWRALPCGILSPPRNSLSSLCNLKTCLMWVSHEDSCV